MSCNQGTPRGHVLASKPSSAFSTTSAASATSAGTSRSGGSKLLFGEIDQTSSLYASVCSFVLCESSSFLKFWLNDACRDTFISHVPKDDLASLRLACHDFSVRAAPALFNDLTITFRSSTLTKPARSAALDRLGFYVKTLQFKVPHTAETFLPPLVDPESGAELSFTYTPQLEAPTAKRPKYGDVGTTEILTRQWPTLFHAATNVPAFVRAFSAFVNLTELTISCPGYDKAQRYRRSIVDFALISLRIAVEQNNLNSLESLVLSPVHPGGILHLSPILGYGATPRSVSRWARIRKLTIHAFDLDTSTVDTEPQLPKLLHTYIRNFQSNLTSFRFRWIGSKGPIPFPQPQASESLAGEHPSRRPGDGSAMRPRRNLQRLHFPKLKHADFEHMEASVGDIGAFAEAHRRTLEEINFEGVELLSGTWDEALAPLMKLSKARPSLDTADIPIMLSPTLPAPMVRMEVAHHETAGGRKSLRMSRWLSTKGRSKAPATRKVREGLLGCEEQLKKVLRSSVFPWRNVQ